MTINTTLKHILWLAIEDYAGLWEAVWEINAHYEDELSPTERFQLAQQVIHEAVAQQWIELFWCQEPYGELWPVEPVEYAQVLADLKYWDAPEDAVISVRISATPAGQQKYHSFFVTQQNGASMT